MDWMQIAQSFGMPTACLAALAFAVYRFARWFAKTVAEPIIKRHMDFTVQVETAMKQQTITLKSICKLQLGQERELTKIRQLLSHTTGLQGS